MNQTKQGRSIIWLIIVVLVVLIGGLVYFNSRRAPVAPDQEAVKMDDGVINVTLPDTNLSISDEVGPSVTVLALTASNFVYSEKELRAKKGERVRLTIQSNDGTHDLVIDALGVQSKLLKTGESDTVEFTVAQVGTFEYYCSVGNHRQMGMTGKLIVSE